MLAAAQAFEPLSIPGLKAAVDACGLYGGPPRRPLLPVTEAERQHLAEAFVGLQRSCSVARGGRAALPAGKIGAKGREIPKGGPPPGSEFGAAPARRSAGLGPQGPQAGVSTSGTRGAAAQGPAPRR